MIQRIGKRVRDNRGMVMAGDWVFVATILVLGAVTGLVTMRQTRLPELADAVRTQSVSSTADAAK